MGTPVTDSPSDADRIAPFLAAEAEVVRRRDVGTLDTFLESFGIDPHIAKSFARHYAESVDNGGPYDAAAFFNGFEYALTLLRELHGD